MSWTFFDAKNTKHSASRLAMPKNEQFPLKCIKLFLPVIRERGSLRVNRKIPSTYQSPLAETRLPLFNPRVAMVYNIANMTV